VYRPDQRDSFSFPVVPERQRLLFIPASGPFMVRLAQVTADLCAKPGHFLVIRPYRPSDHGTGDQWTEALD
jgi:hypothetical protein